MKVVGIYNAEGSLWGELSYVSKKLLGLTQCSLCDLTHGWSPREKRSWREACSRSHVNITLLHLDELSDEQRSAFKQAPTLLVEVNNSWQVLMGSEDISAFKNEPDRFLDDVALRLSRFEILDKEDSASEVL